MDLPAVHWTKPPGIRIISDDNGSPDPKQNLSCGTGPWGDFFPKDSCQGKSGRSPGVQNQDQKDKNGSQEDSSGLQMKILEKHFDDPTLGSRATDIKLPCSIRENNWESQYQVKGRGSQSPRSHGKH